MREVPLWANLSAPVLVLEGVGVSSRLPRVGGAAWRLCWSQQMSRSMFGDFLYNAVCRNSNTLLRALVGVCFLKFKHTKNTQAPHPVRVLELWVGVTRVILDK